MKVEEQNPGYLPIRTVSSMTGVNSVTLRAWERRYGLIKPHRTDTGHRLYSSEDLKLINKILELLDQGIAIGQVKNFLEETNESELELLKTLQPKSSKVKANNIDNSWVWVDASVQDAEKNLLDLAIANQWTEIKHHYQQLFADLNFAQIKEHYLSPLVTLLAKRGSLEAMELIEFFEAKLLNRFYNSKASGKTSMKVICMANEKTTDRIEIALFANALLDCTTSINLMLDHLELNSFKQMLFDNAPDIFVLYCTSEEELKNSPYLPIAIDSGVPVCVSGPWVTEDLPAIRKTGAFSLFGGPQNFHKLFTQLLLLSR